jgi:catechol 2,3-dioxygenase-like lactoylglutathione lyase family enzyme
MMARRLSFILLAIVVAGPGVALAQDASLHHLHLSASTAEAGAQWYIKYMGCTPIAGRADRCQAGPIYLAFIKRDPKGGSLGSAINHIGFSFADIEAKAKEFAAGGVKIVRPLKDSAFGKGKVMFVEDPWGTQIEVKDDLDYLGFHHIHLRSASDDTLKWYQNLLGGKDALQQGRLPGLLYGKFWLLSGKGAKGEEIAPTEGRSVDHLAFSVSDLDAVADAIRKKGIKLAQEPHEVQNAPFKRAATVMSPDGVRIEITQP